MEMRVLGRTGVSVSKFCFDAGMFGYFGNASQADADRMVHRPDVGTDIDKTLGALSNLIHQGKVRMIGTSTFPAEQLVEARWVAERRARQTLDNVQAYREQHERSVPA